MLLGLLAWYWWDFLRTREFALAQVKLYCQRHNIQILDDVVSPAKIGLSRSDTGNLQFVRRFNFEFSSLGDVRYKGFVVLAGKKVNDFQLEPFEVEDAK
jgi:hypothetical protein